MNRGRILYKIGYGDEAFLSGRLMIKAAPRKEDLRWHSDTKYGIIPAWISRSQDVQDLGNSGSIGGFVREVQRCGSYLSVMESLTIRMIV